MSVTLTLETDNAWVFNRMAVRGGTGNLGVYALGGVDAPTPRQCGLGILNHLILSSTQGVVLEWNKTTAKVTAWNGPNNEMPDGTDLTDYVFRWEAHGAF